MLFGKKRKFAIEIKINNIFGDKYIGEGFFVVFINNRMYGKTDKYATVFLCIADELKKFYDNKFNSSLFLDDIEKERIANFYYMQNFTEEDVRFDDKVLLQKIKSLVEWNPESAFDDGSHLIHFDNDDGTRIIGFKSSSTYGKFAVDIKSVEETTISRSEFKNILSDAYEYLQSFIKFF